MHQVSVFADMLGEAGAREGLLAQSMRMIAEAGAGVVVLVNRARPTALSSILAEKAAGKPSDMNELRDYGIGAQVLAELGIHDMILLTNSHHTLVALDGYGLNIVGERPITNDVGERPIATTTSGDA
jgi:3,4-dihydroxy 2-butanone 4-phosphate synthase / GTP cyclohydrolase II